MTSSICGRNRGNTCSTTPLCVNLRNLPKGSRWGDLNPRPNPYEGFALASLSYTGSMSLYIIVPPITAIRIANQAESVEASEGPLRPATIRLVPITLSQAHRKTGYSATDRYETACVSRVRSSVTALSVAVAGCGGAPGGGARSPNRKTAGRRPRPRARWARERVRRTTWAKPLRQTAKPAKPGGPAEASQPPDGELPDGQTIVDQERVSYDEFSE